MEYEVWRKKYRITKFLAGAIYEVELRKEGWFAESIIKNNRPFETRYYYVACEHPQGKNTIRPITKRRKKLLKKYREEESNGYSE